jgi:hypothetical protein
MEDHVRLSCELDPDLLLAEALVHAMTPVVIQVDDAILSVPVAR